MIYYKWKVLDVIEGEEPLIFVELDDDRWNTRIVEIYNDGRQVYADEREECGSFLGKEQYPSFEEINNSDEYFIEEITLDEFESVWKNRKEEFCDKSIVEWEDE